MRGAFNQVGPAVQAVGSAELCQPWRQGPSTAGASRAGHVLPFHEASSMHTAQLGLSLFGKKTNVFHVYQQGELKTKLVLSHPKGLEGSLHTLLHLISGTKMVGKKQKESSSCVAGAALCHHCVLVLRFGFELGSIK